MPPTVCFGQTCKVSWQSTISVGGALYSVPSALVDERVWARTEGAELVVRLSRPSWNFAAAVLSVNYLRGW